MESGDLERFDVSGSRGPRSGVRCGILLSNLSIMAVGGRD